jgi:tetratricopeptide (TPR) repeat protein
MYNRTVTRWLIITAFLALRLAPGAQEAEQLKSAYTHLQQGNATQAVRECKAVLAANPLSAPAHMLLGQAYLSRGDIAMIAEAKAELQQALDLDAGLIWASTKKPRSNWNAVSKTVRIYRIFFHCSARWTGSSGIQRHRWN